MHGKLKHIAIFIIAIVLIVVLGIVGLNLYVGSNYDVKIATDSGVSFFIFETNHKKYYKVNSSLGIKVGTKEFNVKSQELSKVQRQQLDEIEKADGYFTASQYSATPDYVFFYQNNIFYSRYYDTTDLQLSDSETKEVTENIFVYHTDTKQIERIKRKENNLSLVNVKAEALMYLYPELNNSISERTTGKYGLGEIFYDSNRIFFNTYYSSSAKGTTEYLYEYIPANKETKRVVKTHASIIGVKAID